MLSTQIADVDEKGFSCDSWGMSPSQCRAARAWLNIRQDELAGAAGVGISTLKDFENGKRVPIGNNLAAIRAALEARGIGFVFRLDDGKDVPCGISFSITNDAGNVVR